jgi:peptidoglycan/LPS O-acetylase OafA/YrhL
MTVVQSRPRRTATVKGNLYLQSPGFLSVVLLLTYAKFPAPWLPFLFPSTGLLFALGGNLAAALGDRLGTPGAFYRRALRRLLLPLWGFGAVMVPLMLGLGWARDDKVQGVDRFSWSALWPWLFPLSDPHGSAAERFLVEHLWLVKSCLWLVLLTPGLLWLFRRWPLRVAAVPLGGIALLTSGMLVFDPGPVLDSLDELGAFTCCWLVGFAHHDGRLRQLPRGRTVLIGAALAAAGAWYAVYYQADANAYDLNDVPLANLLYSLGTVLILLRLHPALSWTRRVRPLGTVIHLVNRRVLTILIWGNFTIAIVPLALHPTPELVV